MQRNVGKIIDLKILFEELLKIVNSKKYKKEFKGMTTTIESIKKAFIRNQKLSINMYKVKDFLEILKFDFNEENKEELEYKFLRKSEQTQELVTMKENDEYMVMYYLRKLSLTFVYEKLKKLMAKELNIEVVLLEIKKDIDEDVKQTLMLSMIFYAGLHKVEDKDYLNKIDELYREVLEEKIVNENNRHKKEREKEELKLKKIIADLEIERECKKDANNRLKDMKKKNNNLNDENKSLVRALTGIENKFKQPIEFTKSVKEEIKQMVIEERNTSLEKVFESTLNNLNKKFLAEQIKSEKLLEKIEILNNEIQNLNNEIERLKIEEVSATLLEEEVVEESETEKIIQRDVKEDLRFFAKVVIEDNRYYLRFNGGEYEFREEREDKYYVQGEIVLIDGNKKIIKQTDCYDDKHFTGLKYGILQRDFEGVYVVDAYGNKVFNVEDNDNDTLSTASIVAYSLDLKIKIIFKKIRDSIDLYRDCIEAKKHRALIVVDITAGALIVRNALTGKKEIIRIDDIDGLSEEIISVEQLLIVNKHNKFVGIIDNRNYYTYSKNYEKAETVVVKYIDEIPYGEKSNGERIKLNYCNKDLIEEGAVCKMDEFSNILYETENELVVKRTFKESRVNNSTGVNEKIEIIDNIAIIGKTSYKETYKLTFLKHGVEVKFIDGNDNYARIQQGLKDVQKIIVCVNGISHGNMWSIKEHYKNRIINYADGDGANKLYNEYLTMV